jgi:hypothetical protein
VDVLDIAKSVNQRAALGLDQHFMGLDQGHFHAEITKRAAKARLPNQSKEQAYAAQLETPEGRELFLAYKRAPAAPSQPAQDLVPRNSKPSPGPASEELAALARKLARERRITYARAYTQLLTDPLEGHAELAARVREEERAATRAVCDAREPIWQAQRQFERKF